MSSLERINKELQASDLSFDLDFPPKKVNFLEHTKGKKVILLGLPGAFTPTWSTRQIPGYFKAQDELKAIGIDEVMLYCVNDAAVMKAWAKDQKVTTEGTEGSSDNNIVFYADPTGTFTKACDMIMDHPGPIGVGLLGRCKRFALYVEDSVVKYHVVAEDVDFDPAGDDFPEKVLPPQMIAAIQEIIQK